MNSVHDPKATNFEPVHADAEGVAMYVQEIAYGARLLGAARVAGATAAQREALAIASATLAKTAMQLEQVFPLGASDPRPSETRLSGCVATLALERAVLDNERAELLTWLRTTCEDGIAGKPLMNDNLALFLRGVTEHLLKCEATGR